MFLGRQANGPNDIPELFLPGPNEFIPTNFEVEKWQVPEVGARTIICVGLKEYFFLATETPSPHPRNSVIDPLVQEG